METTSTTTHHHHHHHRHHHHHTLGQHCKTTTVANTSHVTPKLQTSNEHFANIFNHHHQQATQVALKESKFVQPQINGGGNNNLTSTVVNGMDAVKCLSDDLAGINIAPVCEEAAIVGGRELVSTTASKATAGALADTVKVEHELPRPQQATKHNQVMMHETKRPKTIMSQIYNRNIAVKAQSIDISETNYGKVKGQECSVEQQVGATVKIKSNGPGPGCIGPEQRPIYCNLPYSPYASPFSSPRTGRRTRPPLRESRRVSIEQSGEFLQLNQYKLLDQIGQGSYGLVKLAYSEEDSTHYAMKILSKRKLLRRAGIIGRGPKKGLSPLDRVYREIAVLKKLDHPNVVKLVEVLDDPIDDSLYLVFELVKQGEVLSIPTDNPFPEERAWSVFRDVVLGLEYLHYQKIIHGDLKPGNLLLGECERVKIADLGVCNEFLDEDGSMKNGSTAGTPAFRAPETLKLGEHCYSGKATDIWALGITLYSLVYGNVPFVSNNVPALYEKIKHDSIHFPPSPHCSAELKDLIGRMLEKDPDRRITLNEIKTHNFTTANQAYPLPTEEENCRLVQINDEDMNSVVKTIPKLDTLILIKMLIKKHSFQNPFGRPSQRSASSRLERFSRAGRSNSAPGAYHTLDSFRQFSTENCLPSVEERCAQTNADADNSCCLSEASECDKPDEAASDISK